VVSASGPITIRFSEFYTTSTPEGAWPGSDYVELYDGASSSAPLLRSLSGRPLSGATRPAAVTSTGTALTVIFTSQPSTATYAGFSATLFSTAMRLVGTVPAMLGDLWCIGRITHVCVRAQRIASSEPRRRWMRVAAGI
jgi:hypothetical protein